MSKSKCYKEEVRGTCEKHSKLKIESVPINSSRSAIDVITNPPKFGERSVNRSGELRKKLAIARGMLYSARGVISGILPADDCTVEDIDEILDATKDDGLEWQDE